MKSKPYGLSIVSFFLGLTMGLIFAAYIAFYVTKTPVPFVDRLNDTNLIDPGDLNSSKGTDNVLVKVLPEQEIIFPKDEIEALITESSKQDENSVKQDKVNKRSSFPKKYIPPLNVTSNNTPLNDKKIEKKPIRIFYLQVGAFRSIDEADRMRARLAFLGFEASLYKKKTPRSVFYRVRLGPFSSKEELNRVKKRLNDDKIKSHVVSGEKN